MRRYQPLAVLILLPALGLFFAAPGCSKKEEPKKSGDGAAQNGDKGKGGKEKAEGPRTELDNKEWGTLSGTVTYDGTPPEPKKINMADNKDKTACHDGAKPEELIEQTWIVNKEKGVANVVIFLLPPEGKFFKIHPSYQEKAKKGEFTLLHQPHCAFIPHASVYWASTYDKDTNELKPSGMKFRVLNDAKFNHNTGWSGDEDYNPKGSVTLEPGKHRDLTFTADLNTPISFKCDIHPWMNAKCWAVDNPYCARTDENGKFKIENAPAGVELRVVAWHEGPGFFYEGGKEGKKMKLDKTTELKIPIKAK
jgi:hypothetical protein